MLKKKGKHINFNQWYDTLNESKMLLMFKGDFNQELVNAIVSLIEGVPEISDEPIFLKTRMSGAIVECLQNICRHGAGFGESIKMKPGIILISKGKDEYIIGIGNPILNSKVKSLRYYLDKVNNLDKEELKKFHKEVLVNAELYGKYGADLGLINMARKSHKKFEFDFRQLDDKYTFFSFEIYVSTLND